MKKSEAKAKESKQEERTKQVKTEAKAEEKKAEFKKPEWKKREERSERDGQTGKNEESKTGSESRREENGVQTKQDRYVSLAKAKNT